MPAKIKDFAAHFWNRVDMSGGPDACWPFLGFRNAKGYGHQWAPDEKRAKHASIVAYELIHGPILPSQQVLHHCDNPPCCNPTHLWRGTNSDNCADKVQKRRHTFGNRHPHAVLTDSDVQRMREMAAAATIDITALVHHLNVSEHTIYAAVRGATWKHVETPPVLLSKLRKRRIQNSFGGSR